MVFCNQQNHRIQVCNSLQQQQCFMSPASVWLSDCWMVQMTATCGFLGTHECQHAFDACVCELVCLYKTVWLHARMCAWILCENDFIVTINVMSVLSITEVSRLFMLPEESAHKDNKNAMVQWSQFLPLSPVPCPNVPAETTAEMPEMRCQPPLHVCSSDPLLTLK